MTAAARSGDSVASRPGDPAAASRPAGPAAASNVVRPLLLVAGLAGLVGARWAATIDGSAGGLAVGLAFGAGLLALALAGGTRLGLPRHLDRSDLSSIGLGVLGGTALVVLALVGLADIGAPAWAASALGSARGPNLGPGAWLAAGFGPWAAITVLVATAEELVLRGVLFEAVDDASGAAAAVVATSLAFALIHVPLYGWHVVPLDLGVGLLLGGLRVVTGRVSAPAAAHAIADLATWWL
jgi:membrane protease YdiL (CAAX protease family)